jgi:hypothetical protein
MDVNFSKNDCCGEGAISHKDTTAVKFDTDCEMVGNNMGTPKSSEYLGGTGNSVLNAPRKRRNQSGRTLRAGS